MNSLIELTLADIMNQNVLHVRPDCTLGEAARQMAEARISSLLIMSDNTLQGIITEHDLLRLLNTHTAMHTPVSVFMSAPVLMASPDTNFTDAYAQVLNHHVRHLVVVDDAGAVIGMASESDFRNHIGSRLLTRLDDLTAVMDSVVTQLEPDASLDQAVAIMLRNSTCYVLAVENGRVEGILTERDLAGLLVSDGHSNAVTLREVMHSPVLTVIRNTPVHEIAGLMQARQVRHMVVLDEDGHVSGMVTLHKLMERLTESLISEQSLLRQQVLENSKQRAESLASSIMKILPDMLWLKDADGFYLSCNRMFERFFGASEAEIIGKTDYDFVSRELADSFHEHDCMAMAASKPCIHEEWIVFADDGHRACIETVKSPVLDADGKLIGVLGIARDITEHKYAAEKIQRLTQLYNVLSQCNQAIVLCKTEAELFPTICRVAVQLGGMSMAWIGMLDGRRVQPVACYGACVEYLDGINISVDAGAPSGCGPTGTAIRENQPQWCQDFQHDSATAPWHQRGEHCGWGASASLPLCQNGVAVGALTLYSAEAHVFDEASRKLLTEMAADIGFALDNFEREAQQANLQQLSETERSLLKNLVSGQALPVVLNQLAVSYEVLFPGMLCSVLLLSSDGLHLTHGAAPSLPAAYCQAIDGVAIGDQVGSCGTAAYTRKTVIVSDISTDPLWQDYKGLALGHGLAACWSVPIFSTQNQLLGTFALYYAAPRSPKTSELNALERGAHLASMAIERAQNEARIQQLAHFDLLTGLPNQMLLKSRFAQAIKLAQRGETHLAVLFLDIDHFKNINDTLGHRIGDELLTQLAGRLKSLLREEDTLSRMGGDEFILVLPDADADAAAHVAEKLLAKVAETFHIDQHELVVTSSIGVAIYPNDGEDFDKLYQSADMAMYRAKHAGRNNFCFYTAEMQARSARRLQLENALRQALARGQLQLHYQPQISMQDGHIVGAEALLRWHHPELGMVSPAEFIPVAEESGLILTIGEWVLRTAVQQLKTWISMGLTPLTIAVNLSAVQFRHPHLTGLVMQILEDAQLPPKYIELELTESVAMDEPLAAIAVMDELHALGIPMSIDDFGTGYSSLSYLKKFKINKLKIDQSFVRNISEDAESRAIVTAIITLASSLGFQTIAEGVETAGQLAFLRLQGCNEVQGYYFSKPLDVVNFEAYLRLHAPV